MKTTNKYLYILTRVFAPLREIFRPLKQYWTFLLLAFCIISANAVSQTSLESLLSNTRENNKTLLTARQLYEAEVVNARTGNSPDNPLVEYAYLWGTPDALGERVDFAVTQSFDFPTAYTSRSRLSKINREQSGLKLELSEQQVIVQARQAWYRAVYLNQKNLILNERLENAKFISHAIQRLFEEGESNQLELNQANLKVTALSNQLKRLEMEKVNNDAVIGQLNGGVPFKVKDTTFPVSTEVVFDSLLVWYRYGPQNMAFQGEVARREQAKDVAFNQKLPKLYAGYYQESILGTQLKGIRAGITIPLWENANAVKSAKAGIAFAQTDAERFWEQQTLQIGQLYEQWSILNKQVIEMQQLLTNSNNDDLLIKALKGGEISITQYYYETDFYFQNQFDLLDLQIDLYLLETELMRVTY